MSLDDLIKMKEKALEMSKYYYKGFGNTIQGILANAECYLEGIEKRDYVKDAYEWFKEIEDFYAKIPFDSLHGKEEFYPLFIIKRLLPTFKESMDNVFQHKEKDELHTLNTNSTTIVNVGRLYGDSFLKLLKEIRTHPETSNFRIKITDYKNDVWHF